MLRLENRRPDRGWQIAGRQTPAAQRAAATIVVGAVLITTVTMMAYAPERGPMRTVGSETKSATGRTDAPLKVIGGVTDAGKPCEEQTWPYKDRHCLTTAGDKPNTERAEVAEPTTSKPSGAAQADQSGQQAVGSTTAIAPTPPVSNMTQAVGETTGSRTVPILPSEMAKQQTGAASATVGAGWQASAPPPQNAKRPLTRREQRQEQRRLARDIRRFDHAARPAPPARTATSTDGRAATRGADDEEIETINLRRPHRKLGPLEPDDNASTRSTERRVPRGSVRTPPRRVIVVD